MSKPSIALIGLGLTGTSLGLALHREPLDFTLVGHDKEPDASAEARKMGAVDRTEWNLFRTIDGAGMVIMSVPLSELVELLPLMSEELQPGTVLLILSSMIDAAASLAHEHLPDGVHFVVGRPVLSGVGGSLTPRADLFEETLFCLAPTPNADSGAVQLATDFVSRLGAKPFFIDAVEHDSSMANVEQLPQIVAAALTRLSSQSPQWQETQKLAGRQFAQSSEMRHSPQQLASAFRTNRVNLVRQIQALEGELAAWRALLEQAPSAPEQEQADPLHEALTDAAESRAQWEGQATLARWDEPVADLDRAESSSGIFRQLFFGNLARRRGPSSDRT